MADRDLSLRERCRQGVGIVLLRDASFWEKSPRRRWTRVAVVGCYTYLGVLFMLLALENYFLFPLSTFDRDWAPLPPGLTVQDVELTLADGTLLHGWWTQPPGWTPRSGVILFSHGNGGNVSHRGGAAGRWRDELRRAFLVYDYPGYGKSRGRPTEEACYAAGEAAYRWLVEEHKVAGDEVIHVGESLGGAIATELAVRYPCRMLILLSTFTSFPDMAQKTFPWLPARWLVRNRLDNLAKIGNVGCPVFLAHGTADSLVPFWMSERLHAAAREPKRFFPIAGLEHLHPEGAEFYAAVRDFLDETQQ